MVGAFISLVFSDSAGELSESLCPLAIALVLVLTIGFTGSTVDRGASVSVSARLRKARA